MQKQGTLAEWIVKKCMTKAYIIGKNSQTKHFKVEDELRELFEKKELETQAYELERNGLITCKRWSVNQIVGLDVPLRNIPKICDRIKIEDDISEENQKGRSKSIAQDLILSEFHIMTYSQNLTLKGALEYEVRRGEKTKIVSTKDQYYGTVINAQTLMNSEPTSLQGIKKIVTVENQANYEDMPYEEGCVYIFVHGFPSFKERNFILEMLKLAEDGIEVFHWGDMDFGELESINI